MLLGDFVAIVVTAVAQLGLIPTVAAQSITSGCDTDCTAFQAFQGKLGWGYAGFPNYTQTLTYATVVTIIDDETNTTSTTTEFAEIPQGITLPPMNEAGTRTGEWVVETAVGEFTTVTLAYPTVVSTPTMSFIWKGTLLTSDTMGHDICSTATHQYVNLTGWTATLSTYAETTNSKDPKGHLYTLDSGDINCQGMFPIESLPESIKTGALESCPLKGGSMMCVAPAAAIETVAFLTADSTRHKVKATSSERTDLGGYVQATSPEAAGYKATPSPLPASIVPETITPHAPPRPNAPKETALGAHSPMSMLASTHEHPLQSVSPAIGNLNLLALLASAATHLLGQHAAPDGGKTNSVSAEAVAAESRQPLETAQSPTDAADVLFTELPVLPFPASEEKPDPSADAGLSRDSPTATGAAGDGTPQAAESGGPSASYISSDPSPMPTTHNVGDAIASGIGETSPSSSSVSPSAATGAGSAISMNRIFETITFMVVVFYMHEIS